jgi:hypothetical protein
MTNEELIEEIYWTAHQYGVIDTFRDEVYNRLKTTTNRDNIVVVEEVYYEYIQNGLIGVSGNVY